MAAASLRRYLLLCNHFPDLLTNALVALKFSLDPGWLSALFFLIKRPTWLLHLVCYCVGWIDVDVQFF
jgi:hypothetical protein